MMRLLSLLLALASALEDSRTLRPEDPEIPRLVGERRDKIPFMDVEYYLGNDKQEARIVFELFWDVTPRTALNFALLLEGYERLSYRNHIFHRIIWNFMMQGGDIDGLDGMGGKSVYGGKFRDENFVKKHEAGSLSMANSGPDTNGSQFFICFVPSPHLNGKHTVFGRVSPECMPEVLSIRHVPADGFNKPLKNVTIVDCGLLGREEMKSRGMLGGSEGVPRPKDDALASKDSMRGDRTHVL